MELFKIKFYLVPLLATNDFTSPDLNDSKLSNTMIFGNQRLDTNFLKASEKVFELMSLLSSKRIPRLKQSVNNKIQQFVNFLSPLLFI